MNGKVFEKRIREVLLTSLHQDSSRIDPTALSLLIEREWAALVEMATRHGVASLVYQRLKTSELAGRVPDNQLERLRGLDLQTAACNMRLYEELRVLLSALSASGIPVIVLKGAYLAEKSLSKHRFTINERY